MIKKFLLPVVLFSVPLSAPACELPKGKAIKIGCSYKCDFFYRMRITMTGWSLGYKTEIKNLEGASDLKSAMSDVDALLIPGGADIDPKYYLESVSPELQDYTKKNVHLAKLSNEGARRDPFEYDLVKTYSQDESFKDVPLLGICRGLQMMSVAQGIPLYLDIKTELGIKNRKALFDRITPVGKQGDLMKSLYSRKKTIKGYKFHHQGIRVPYYEENKDKYPLTKVTAYSHGGKIAEAIEYIHRPALGVQYHPERSFPGASAPVFKWFLKKACEHKVLGLKDVVL